MEKRINLCYNEYGDNMKNKLWKSLVFIFYLLSFFILLFCIRVRLTPNIYIKTNIRIILLLLSCLFIHISGYILIKKLNYDKKILRINLIVYFLIYTVTICTLTLFDEIFGRQGLVIVKWNKELLDLYMKYSFNIVPFRTINLFISGYAKGIVNFRSFNINILGNLTAFMPYAIFLPLIFKKMNKFKNFIITITLTVIVIEILQFVTMSGSCDIDDLILNVFGASVVYFVAKIKCINKFIHKVFLYE